MDKKPGNALKRARNSKGITQERLAEMSGYSVDSIQAWESELRNPSNSTLDLLGICLDAPWLTAVFLREQSEGGSLQAAIPEFTPGEPLPQAVLSLLEQVYKFVDQHSDRRLMAIAADGKITDEERPEFDDVMEDLNGITKAAMALRYAKTAE